MSKPTKTTPEDNAPRQQTVRVVATFASLMHARERGDASTAAEEQGELAQLGVVVAFTGTGARRDAHGEGRR